VTGQCRRCGRGCEGRLCPACREFAAALHRLEMKYPAATKKSANRKERPVQAAQQQSNKVRPSRLSRRNGLSSEPDPAKRLRQRSAQRTSGADSLLEFFHAADVDARLGPAGHLWIDGAEIERLTQVPSPETAEWINVVNEISMTYLRDRFTGMVEKHARLVADFGAFLLPRERGVAIMHDDERLGGIYPAYASFPPRPLIYANFLTAGPHWQRVANALRDTENKRAAKSQKAEAKRAAKSKKERKAARTRHIDQLPDDLAPELIAACLDASRRIRHERRLDYGDTPVVLEYDAGELTLLPITGPATRLLVPFRLSKGTQTLTGELILGRHDPLSVQIGRDVADEDAITAWICVLLGFADATCINLDSAEPATRRAPRPRRRPRTPEPRPQPPAQALPSKHRWPSYLEPIGHTVRYVDSLVRGHLRLLPHGQTARDDARDRAHRIGIILRPGETWVQPHIRGHGLPDGAELRFLWHAPSELTLSRRS
jgi:hypothetical protein